MMGLKVLFSKAAGNYQNFKMTKTLRQLVTLSVFASPSNAFLVLPTTIHHRSLSTTSVSSNSVTVLPPTAQQRSVSSSKRFMSSGTPDIQHVGRAQMEEIVDDFENGGREDSEYCVIDVRTYEEVASTGKLAPSVYTLPVQVIMQHNVFAMDADDFEELCGFEKPTPDETLVFSCAAGIRSVYACQFAAKAGYTKLVNYAGGANEWFTPTDF